MGESESDSRAIRRQCVSRDLSPPHVSLYAAFTYSIFPARRAHSVASETGEPRGVCRRLLGRSYKLAFNSKIGSSAGRRGLQERQVRTTMGDSHATPESRFAGEILCPLRTSFLVAQEMGPLLGRSEVLQRCLPSRGAAEIVRLGDTHWRLRNQPRTRMRCGGQSPPCEVNDRG